MYMREYLKLQDGGSATQSNRIDGTSLVPQL